MTIEKKVKDLIENALTEKGFKLMQVTYTKENGLNFLRIVIDREDPVNLDDCVAATKIVNHILDKEDIIDEQYILDVCSYERGGK